MRLKSKQTAPRIIIPQTIDRVYIVIVRAFAVERVNLPQKSLHVFRVSEKHPIRQVLVVRSNTLELVTLGPPLRNIKVAIPCVLVEPTTD